MSSRLQQDKVPSPKKKGFVFSGGLANFGEDVPDETKKDIMNALLYAQLSANKMLGHTDDTAKWYQAYVSCLKKIGFQIDDVEFNKDTENSEKVTLGDVVVSDLVGMANATAVGVIKASIQVLRSLSMSDKKLKLFYSKCSSTKRGGNFQVGHVEQMPDGKVSLLLAMYCYTTVSSVEHILNYMVDRENTKLCKRIQKAVFDPGSSKEFRKFFKDYPEMLKDDIELVTSLDFD